MIIIQILLLQQQVTNLQIDKAATINDQSYNQL